jgi:hypothetical protein
MREAMLDRTGKTEAADGEAPGNMNTSCEAEPETASASTERINRSIIHRKIYRGQAEKRGRPLSVTPDIIQRAYYACAECGANLGQLSKLLPVSLHTLNNWMRYDKAFRSVVRQGMDVFNSSKAEKSLLKRALGYEFDEVVEQDVELYGKNSLGMKVLVPAHKTTTTHRVLPPDVGALVFYLTNRDPSRWRQTYRQETSSTTETYHEHNITVDLSRVPKEDLEILRNILKRAEPEGTAIGPSDQAAGGRRARQNVLA